MQKNIKKDNFCEYRKTACMYHTRCQFDNSPAELDSLPDFGRGFRPAHEVSMQSILPTDKFWPGISLPMLICRKKIKPVHFLEIKLYIFFQK